MVDLSVSKRLTRILDLNFSVDNLLNKKYYETQNFFESRVCSTCDIASHPRYTGLPANGKRRDDVQVGEEKLTPFLGFLSRSDQLILAVGFNPRKPGEEVIVASATIESVFSAVADATEDVFRERTVP